MKALLPLIGAAMMASFATQSQAQQLITLGASGDWVAFRSTGGGSYRPLCAISNRDSARDISLYIKWQPDNPGVLFVQAYKAGWSIPANVRAQVELRFDNATSLWRAQATPTRSSGGLEWSINPNSIGDFSQQFRLGNRLEIRFPDGNEAPWYISLRGSNAIVPVFVECMRTLGGGSSQPYGSGPTQPFGQPSRPTQPFQQNAPAPTPSAPAPSRKNPSGGPAGTI